MEPLKAVEIIKTAKKFVEDIDYFLGQINSIKSVFGSAYSLSQQAIDKDGTLWIKKNESKGVFKVGDEFLTINEVIDNISLCIEYLENYEKIVMVLKKELDKVKQLTRNWLEEIDKNFKKTFADVLVKKELEIS
ncbi:MAG: hypothetical protein QXW83_00605 [Nitrososphaerales archaeon]